ncbi:energy-coupling factor transport system substrate-specific component [Aurantimicrobium minutum]|uniref:ECF transporter S component n=1 Tax=Aurantimicrobium minutum TaxID=708131 RepID=UPI002476D32A|nr:ECF transporter S component [Aurantimicrobium minutum]MDH6532728.1 energy-coupling factor transport system substrate-specific component [Aurantimicrobium minutum]
MHATTVSKYRWRVVDIVVASVIGVASGIIFWAWGLAYGPLSVALAATPGLTALLGGGWLFAAILGALIVRKPGAAIYTELIAATVSALIGSQWGFGTLVSGLVQGIGAEIIFALFLYANWSVFTSVLAGAGAGVAMSINDLLVWYPGVDALFQATYVVCAVISGALLGGLVPWFMVRGLARAGALTRFAAGRQNS